MKYLLLSLLANILILLIPLNMHKEKKQQVHKIVVTLNLQEKKKEPKKLLSPAKKQPAKKVVKKVVKKKVVKKKTLHHKKRVAKKKVLHHKKVAKKKIKTPASQSLPKVVAQNTLPVNKHAKTVQKAPAKSSAPKKSECVENVDFKILKRPDCSYPRSAKRLRLRSAVSVNVYFKIADNGEIIILNAKGGNALFQTVAKNRTMDMKVALLNKSAVTCKIVQPFRFEP